MTTTLTEENATPAVVADAADSQASSPENIIRKQSWFRRYVHSRAIGWTFVVLLIVGWQIKSNFAYDPTISAPIKIAQTWWTEVSTGTLLSELFSTLRTMAIGLAIAVPIGVGLGFLMGRSRVIWGIFEPPTEIMRITPITAVLPIFILYFGIEEEMKIAVFVVAGVFPMIINSYAGARSVSKVLHETALTFRLSWWQTQREVAFPSATPFILVGLRQALGISLVLAVVVGMLAGNSGIGYYIMQAQQEFNMSRLLAAVITVAAVGYLLNAIFLILERRTTRWRGVTLAR